MACLRFMFDNQEIDRRDVNGAVVIGRAADCDVAVRDILLSRRHCRIESGEDGTWRVVDLGSKNGTALNARPITAAAELRDGDEVKLGRVTVQFRGASLAELGLTALRQAAVGPRPADPTETLSGTLMGFKYLEPGASEGVANCPLPRPEPKRPAAYEREKIDALLSAIASSSWDSIYEQARKPVVSETSRSVEVKGERRVRPASPICQEEMTAAKTRRAQGKTESGLQVFISNFKFQISNFLSWRSLRLRRRLLASALAAVVLTLLIFHFAWPAAVEPSPVPARVQPVAAAPVVLPDRAAVFTQAIAAALPVFL